MRQSHRRHMEDEQEEEHDAQQHSHAAVAASSSSAAASATAAAAAASASAAAASNPLASLLRDLQCGICLSVASDPTSLPCHHFFCSACLQRQMDAEASAEKAKRKAKSNETLRRAMTCPICRAVYTRRTIVEDPLIQRMATLALQLKRCADVQELVEPEEGIFELSQTSAPMQPSPQRITRARSAESMASMEDSGAAAAAAATTPTRRHSSAKHSTPAAAAAAAAAPSPATRSTPASASKAGGAGAASIAPPAPYDPFAFHSSETQRSSQHETPARPSSAAAAAALPLPRAAQFSTPTRSGRVARRNYKEQSQESLDDHASDGASGSDHDDDEDESSEEDDAADPMDISMLHSSAAAASASDVSMQRTPGSSAKKPRKGYPIKELPAGTCAVCCQHSEEEETVTCKLCKVSVHRQLCYGPLFGGELDAKARSEWYCDRCSPSMGTKAVSCALCPNLDDQAFKKTDQGTWVHASCALWIPECRYRNPDQRQLVIIRDVKKDRYTVPCNFCTGKGAIIQCTFPNCSFSYHAPCGMRRGIEFELWRANGASQLMSQEEGADDVFYHNFCAKHAPLKHKVPACNSAVAVSAKKQKKKNKAANNKGGGAKRRREEKAARRERASASSDDSDTNGGGGAGADSSSKRARSSLLPADRSDDAASRVAADASNAMSISMADEVTSSMETPGRATPMTDGPQQQPFSIAALVSPTGASPFNAHTPIAAAAGVATRRSSSSGSAHASPIQPALSISRKLDFPTTPTPAAAATAAAAAAAAAAASAASALPNVTTSIGISTRRSPLKAQLPPMVRSASMGSVSSSAAASPAAMPAPELSRPASLRKRGASPATMDSAAAAGGSPAAAAASFATPSRLPLRSMDRAEVHARDHPPVVKLEAPLAAAAAASSSSAAASTPSSSSRSAGRALAKRHHMVLMGTRLDSEQSALLEELAALLNDLAKEAAKSSTAKKLPAGSERFVSVQSHWDDSVTHVVTAASDANGFILPSRTVKYFQGLLSSAWVVGIDWVAASICARRVVSESEYLVQGDAKLNGGEITQGAKRARANRESLFANQHFVLVQPFKPALRKDVQQLIEMGGGDVREAFPTPQQAERRGRKPEANEGHASDIEEADEASQSSLPSPAKSSSSKGGSAAAAAASSYSSPALAAAALSKRWYLLSDDTSSQTRAQLSKHIAPALAKMCAQQNIAIVGVNWLFDSISAMKLRPVPS